MNNEGTLYFGLLLTSDSLKFAMIILGSFLLLATVVSRGHIYKKAGKSALSAYIPIWSQITLFQIAKKPWWYIFLLIVPIVSIVILIQTFSVVAKKFGKGTGFAVAMFFLPMIFNPLLSFYDYLDTSQKEDEPVYNPFNQDDVNQVMPKVPMNMEGSTQINSINFIDENSNSVVPSTTIEPVDGSNVQENVNNMGIISETNFNANVQVVPSIQTEIPSINEESNINSFDNIKTEINNTGSVVNINDNLNDSFISTMQEESNVITNISDLNDNSLQKELSVLGSVSNSNNIENLSLGNVNNLTEENQDIQEMLKIQSSNEPKNIAFNSVPNIINESEVYVDSLDDNVSISEEVIEMPEIAAKCCPACGVSLAEDVKFCTSCGTQL